MVVNKVVLDSRGVCSPVLNQLFWYYVNTVRPVFESQQWPQAGCAHHALHSAELRFHIIGTTCKRWSSKPTAAILCVKCDSVIPGCEVVT